MSKALELAKILHNDIETPNLNDCKHAAAELRRLHEVNAMLLEQLKNAKLLLKMTAVYTAGEMSDINAAIAKAEGQK